MTEYLLLAAAMLLTGAVGGVLAGLLGIGGGIVIVPVMELALTWLGVTPSVFRIPIIFNLSCIASSELLNTLINATPIKMMASTKMLSCR